MRALTEDVEILITNQTYGRCTVVNMIHVVSYGKLLRSDNKNTYIRINRDR